MLQVLPHGVVVSLVLLPSDGVWSVGLVGKLCEVGKPASFGLCVCVCVCVGGWVGDDWR